VTLKVSRVKQLLPSKRKLLQEKSDTDKCLERVTTGSWKEPVSGPLLPNGSFQVRYKRFEESFRSPRPADWKPAKNVDHVRCPAIFFSRKEKRMLIGKPSRRARKTIPKGDCLVLPTRICIANFQRRVQCIEEITDIVRYLGQHDDPDFQRKNLITITKLLPDTGLNFANANNFVSKLERSIWFFLRKSQKGAGLLRSGAELR